MSIRRSLGLGVSGKKFNALERNFFNQSRRHGQLQAQRILKEKQSNKNFTELLNLHYKREKQLLNAIRDRNNEIGKLRKQIQRLSRKKGVKSSSARLTKSKTSKKRRRSSKSPINSRLLGEF